MRDFAQIRIAVWNDDDFRKLSPFAQLLYFTLLSHPSMNYAGVGDWRPKRIAKLAHGWSPDLVEDAAAELIEGLYILVDDDTEEYLVRSFVRNDSILKQPKLSVSMARAFAVVASAPLRGVIVWELRRLKKERPGLAAWKQGESAELLDKEAINPSTYPLGKGSVKGLIKGFIYPSIYPKSTPNEKHEFRGPFRGSIQQQQQQPTSNNQLSTEGVTEVGNVTVRAREENDAPSPEKIPDEWVEIPSLARCTKHKKADNPPPCPKCKQARLAAEKLRDEREAARQSAARARRAAINNCTLCDEHGIARVPGGRTRCPHDQEQLAQLHAQAQADMDARAQAEQDRAKKANSPETVQGRWRRKREATTHILDPHEPLPPNTHIIDAETVEKHTETGHTRDNTPPPDTHPNKWHQTPQNPQNKDTT